MRLMAVEVVSDDAPWANKHRLASVHKHQLKGRHLAVGQQQRARLPSPSRQFLYSCRFGTPFAVPLLLLCFKKYASPDRGPHSFALSHFPSRHLLATARKLTTTGLSGRCCEDPWSTFDEFPRLRHLSIECLQS
jgi:hypothetical protein